MKLSVLAENTAAHPDYLPEHGLSLYLETEAGRILFDMGQTDAFAKNAARLGVDLAGVDYAILSHGHYDHGGGLKRFLEINEDAPVYLSRYAFEPHFNGTEKYIGLDVSLLDEKRLIYTDTYDRICEGAELYSCHKKLRPFATDPYGMYAINGGAEADMVVDDFRHEQYLLLKDRGRRILISGCSHKGIRNLMHWFAPDVFIGGFHFMKLEPDGEGREALAEAAEALMQYPSIYYTGHCTGLAQFDALKSRLGDRITYLSTGSQFEI